MRRKIEFLDAVAITDEERRGESGPGRPGAAFTGCAHQKCGEHGGRPWRPVGSISGTMVSPVVVRGNGSKEHGAPRGISGGDGFCMGVCMYVWRGHVVRRLLCAVLMSKNYIKSSANKSSVCCHTWKVSLRPPSFRLPSVPHSFNLPPAHSPTSS